jgi:hypothetical protein
MGRSQYSSYGPVTVQSLWAGRSTVAMGRSQYSRYGPVTVQSLWAGHSTVDSASCLTQIMAHIYNTELAVRLTVHIW